MNSTLQPWTVRPIHPGEVTDVLQRLFPGDSARQAYWSDLWEQTTPQREFFLVAQHRQTVTILGAVLGIHDEGTGRLLAGPEVFPAGSTQAESIAGALLQGFHQKLLHAGGHHAEFFLPDPVPGSASRNSEDHRIPWLMSAGYFLLTRVEERLWQAGNQTDTATGHTVSFEWQNYREAPTEVFRQVFLDTHEDTLDCPWLNQFRPPVTLWEEMQRKYPDKRRWWLITLAGTPVGCVIVGDSTSGAGGTLGYLGLRKAYRGCGWGHTIVQDLCIRMLQMSIKSLSVSVDNANVPACRSYAKAGFQLVRLYRMYVWQGLHG